MENTLLYSFSTIAQVLAALTALTGIFLFYRIEGINNLLIGQGIAILKGQRTKIDNKVQGEPLLTEIEYCRLRDAIDRKNIYGIEEILLVLTNQEFETGITETGYVNNVYKNFRNTKEFLKTSKIGTIVNICVLIIPLILSIVNINQIPEILLKSNEVQNCILWNTTFIFISSLVLTMAFVAYLILWRVGFEKTKIDESKSLKKDYKKGMKTANNTQS